MQSRIQSVPESLSLVLVWRWKYLYFLNKFLPNPVHDQKRINIFIEWLQSNGDWGGMTRINYFFNMSVVSLYSRGSLLNESITTAKLLSENMTTNIQWLLHDYKNRSHFLLGLRRIKLYKIKIVIWQEKLTQSYKETICRPCSAERISTYICS